MSGDGEAFIDMTSLDRGNQGLEATAVTLPDGRAADASFHPFVDLDGSGVVGYYEYAREDDAKPTLERVTAGPEKQVYKGQAMHRSDDDGQAASNVGYAESQIPQPVRKTFPVVDIFVKDQEQEPQDPSIGFPEPPPLPESFPREPVPQGGKGEGWPYAPQGWPKPDDKWGWKVGQRAAANSLWIDRYVTLPASLMKGKKVHIPDEQFASKKSLAEYLRQAFPQLKDPNSIFKAFDWKVPAVKNVEIPEKRGLSVRRDKTVPMDGDDSWQKAKRQCRAGNPHCPLTKGKFNESESLERLVCNICCTEPNFCRECKCILCCKFFAPDTDDFCIIRCLNKPLLRSSSCLSKHGICGHAAHLECALNSQLAGVIKKNRLNLEYICRRCDRKTNLKETLGCLVSEFMTAKGSKVERSLQLLLRVVEDPGDEASSSGRIRKILLGALKKVQEGADIVASCEELTEQLLEVLQTGQDIDDSQVSRQVSNWSQARVRNETFEDSEHFYENRVDEWGTRSKSVGSPDAQATLPTFMFPENKSTTLAINARHGCSSDTSPAVHRIDPNIVSKEVGEGNRVTATIGTRLEPGPDMDKQSSRISLQSSLEPDDILLSTPTVLPGSPLLSSLDQSVHKLPTLSVEEHIRQCEAMTDRVKGAGTLGVLPNSDSKPPSLTNIYHGNQANIVGEAAADTRPPPSPKKLVTSIPSSSRAKSPSSFSSQDAIKDYIENTGIVELRKSSRLRPVTRSSSRLANRSQDVDGHHSASAKLINNRNSSRKKPRISSPGAKGPSLFDSPDEGGDDVAVTQVVEVPKCIEPLQITPLPIIPASETTPGAGLELELEDKISEALQNLKRAQAAEYARVEVSLNAQKNIILEQLRQLGKLCDQFAKETKAEDQRDTSRAELDRAMNRLIDSVQEGQKVLESFMLAISDGYGQASEGFSRDYVKRSPSKITEA